MKARFASLLVLWLAGAAAAPLPPDASRAELERWFAEQYGRDGSAGVRRWLYTFAAADGRRLEALSVALVSAGYEIVSLTASGSSAELVVARAEALTPLTLERRNRELARRAREQGARYRGVALP